MLMLVLGSIAYGEGAKGVLGPVKELSVDGPSE